MKLTDMRKKAGLSQSRLAARAGLHPSTISAIESGRLVPYPVQLRKIADALGWKGAPEDLLSEND